MEKFYVSSPQKEHHAKCEEECQRSKGSMIKCMNPSNMKKVPCDKIIHVLCSDIPPEHVKFLKVFYCTDCVTSDDRLSKALAEAKTKAKGKYEQSQAKTTFDDFKRLEQLAQQMAEILKRRDEEVNKLLEIEKRFTEAMNRQSVELKNLKDHIDRLESDKNKKQDRFSLPSGQAPDHASTFLDQLQETISQANQTDTLFSQRSRTMLPSDNTFNVNASQHRVISGETISVSQNMSHVPDYARHESEANAMSDTVLHISRSMITKPIPFTGDVSKWPIFISEFMRTRERGCYRDFEDMDRLRELIQGEARDMFNVELSDTFAEPISTLQRLDEFYGVKGTAVKVALDRIIALPIVEKPTDKEKLKKLYTLVKELAMHCRLSNCESELSSAAVIYLIEEKMFTKHQQKWRMWAQSVAKLENIETIALYIEEKIRELNLKPLSNKSKLKAEVNFIADYSDE